MQNADAVKLKTFFTALKSVTLHSFSSKIRNSLNYMRNFKMLSEAITHIVIRPSK